MSMELLLIIGLVLAFAQFALFVYLHRYQLGLVKSFSVPMPRQKSFLEQNAWGLYFGFCLGVIFLRFAQNNFSKYFR